MHLRHWTGAFFIGLLTLVSNSTAQELSFGVIPEVSTQNTRADWEPLIADLNRKTGLNVVLYFSSDYAGMIDAMRENKIQIGLFGNKSAIEAVDKSNATVFAQKVAADASLGYYSHLIVHKNSKLNSVNDVLRDSKALNYGNGDLNSTSGYLIPEFYIFAKNSVDSKTAFRSSRNASHEVNALAVANRQVDVATNNSGELAKFEVSYPEKFKEIKIIWTSPIIPLDPLLMRKDLPPAVASKLKSFFSSYGQNDDREKRILLKIDNLKGFKESSDKQLAPIRQLDLYARRIKVLANENMGESEKNAIVLDIDKKLKSLE
jgi:phosphonate transport system substrate-binding protein